MNLAALLFAALTLAAAHAAEAQHKMDNLIDTAVNGRGRAYFEAEGALRAAPDVTPLPAAPRLEGDPAATLILQVLQQWRLPQAREFERALEYLDTLPARLAKTPITRPSPSGIAAYLSLHFSSRVAGLLAVHLIKQTDWPYWRTSGVLLYLRKQSNPEITTALIRFVYQTQDKDWVASAIESLRSAHDPALQDKIRAEERYGLTLGLGLPAALKLLADERQVGGDAGTPATSVPGR